VAVLIPRIRSINVRLSEEEYLALERFCAATSARSMSDLVRKAMQSVMAGANQESALASSVNEYSIQVRELEQKVEKLAAELAALKSGTKPRNVDESGDSDATFGGSDALEN
jgi:hypothetical protein